MKLHRHWGSQRLGLTGTGAHRGYMQSPWIEILTCCMCPSPSGPLSTLSLSRRCEPLAAALAVNRGLINFDLSYNRLLPPEALAIGKALRQNKRLKALNVSGNKFGEVGAIHLVEAVKYNRHLEVWLFPLLILGEGGCFSDSTCFRLSVPLLAVGKLPYRL